MESLTSPDSEYRVKAKTFRAHVRYLEKTGKLAAVRALLSPEVAELVEHPPLPGAWLDGTVMNEIVRAVYDLDGGAGVREMMRHIIDDEMLSFFAPVLQGIVRILGTSPSFLFGRYQVTLRNHLQGVDFEYAP